MMVVMGTWPKLLRWVGRRTGLGSRGFCKKVPSLNVTFTWYNVSFDTPINLKTPASEKAEQHQM